MEKDNIILKKSFDFALQIIEFSELLEGAKKYVISKQLLKSGTSIGANVREAQNSESRADFIHKMQIVLKELRESHFWIKFIIAAKLITTEDEVLKFLFNESKELASITAKSVVSAKSKLGKNSSQS